MENSKIETENHQQKTHGITTPAVSETQQNKEITKNEVPILASAKYRISQDI